MSVQPRGNLIDYGICQESSDLRCHVCYGEGYLYVYKTNDGIAACSTGNYPLKPAYQPGVTHATATGYLVPPDDICGCKRVKIPPRGQQWALDKIDKQSDTGKKGSVTARLVAYMLKHGLIPMPLGSEEVGDQRLQIEGVDILVFCRLRIQVKCDWDGGRDGTGNLFLQMSETNPLGRH